MLRHPSKLVWRPRIEPSTEAAGDAATPPAARRPAAPAQPRSPGDGRPAWGLAVPIALITFAAFLPATGNGFVNWDDDKNFLENMAFRGLGRAQLAWAARTFWLAAYQPLAWLLFEVQYTAFGLDPRGYHLTSLALHAANAVALYALTLALLDRCAADRGPGAPRVPAWTAAMAATLFAVHPLRVEAVAWASGQPYLPCALFSILAVLAYLRATTAAAAPRRAWLAASLALFLAALLSHAVAVGLPVVLLILDAYPLRRLSAGTAAAGAALREKIPFIAASLVFTGLAVAARSQTLAAVPPNASPAAIAQACYGTWFYALKTALPTDLAAVYPAPRAIDWREPRFLIAIVAMATITGGLFLARRRQPGLFAAWMSYLAILAPNSGLIRVGHQLAADRYSYLATMGWAAVFAAGLARISRPTARRRPAAFGLIGLLIAVVAGLSALTWAQCRTWRDSTTLWSHALRHGAADSPVAHYNLGLILFRQSRYAAAADQFAESVRLDPGDIEARNSLGVALQRQGRLEAAASRFVEALDFDPDHRDAHFNLGVVYSHQGRFAEAATQYAEALRIDPRFARAHNNLGVDLVRQGRHAAAAAHFDEAARLDPRMGPPRADDPGPAGPRR